MSDFIDFVKVVILPIIIMAVLLSFGVNYIVERSNKESEIKREKQIEFIDECLKDGNHRVEEAGNLLEGTYLICNPK